MAIDLVSLIAVALGAAATWILQRRNVPIIPAPIPQPVPAMPQPPAPGPVITPVIVPGPVAPSPQNTLLAALFALLQAMASGRTVAGAQMNIDHHDGTASNLVMTPPAPNAPPKG